jgi:hypothetical protein
MKLAVAVKSLPIGEFRAGGTAGNVKLVLMMPFSTSTYEESSKKAGDISIAGRSPDSAIDSSEREENEEGLSK